MISRNLERRGTHHTLPAHPARPHPRRTQRGEPIAQLDLVDLDKVEPDHPLARLCALLRPARPPIQRLLDELPRAAGRVRGREKAVRRDELGEEDVEPVERLGRVRREVVREGREERGGAQGRGGEVGRGARCRL